MKLYVSHFIFISPPFFYYIKKNYFKKICYYLLHGNITFKKKYSKINNLII